jgi:hypothetical protein
MCVVLECPDNLPGQMDVHNQKMANAAAGELPAAVQAMAVELSDGLRDKISSSLTLESGSFVDDSNQRMASSPRGIGRSSSQVKGPINIHVGVLGRDSLSRPSKVVWLDAHSSQKDSAKGRKGAASHGRRASFAFACIG